MYAKFDKLAAELSDDEDARPSVTRLSGPSRVTIGPAGASVAQPQAEPPWFVLPPGYHWEPRPNPPIGPQRKPGTNELDYSKWDNSDDDAYEYVDDEDEGDAMPAAPARDVDAPAAPAAQAPAAEQPAAASGSARASRAAEFSRNGGAANGYLWSQSEAEVTVSALVPPGTRARDVQVRLIAAPHPAGVPAGPAEPPVLRISLAGAPEPVLQAALAYAVEAPGGADADVDGECDWELTDFDADAAGAPPRRAVRVTLRKPSPGGAVVHWWARALAGGPAIDTSAIADRGRTAARTAAARDAWAEAEAEFKRRTREFQRVEVDVGDGSGGVDDDAA